MIDRSTLRLSAALLVVGFVLYVVVGLFHPDGPANDHPVVFLEYASSPSWTVVHLGQFAGMSALIVGLIVLRVALGVQGGGAALVARLGAVFAAMALGLYGVLQGVDGVALKQAVNAWATAPEAEKAARFASAETIRWLEWGTRSYHCFTFGIALILLGAAVAISARLPKALGYLMALSGLAYLVQGWVLGAEGFPDSNTVAILVGYALLLAWTVLLVVVASRARGSLEPNTQERAI
ncbi:hypothetical protein ACQPX6_28535 [Actinomycetospora sp. CA-101289]|uniref:hypothetical protein n=1 Tax=Actinomycetospora sp. CA-101289 TaxID=3239893 RepID=UPI003D994383